MGLLGYLGCLGRLGLKVSKPKELNIPNELNKLFLPCSFSKEHDFYRFEDDE